jgi:hypothetical protein
MHTSLAKILFLNPETKFETHQILSLGQAINRNPFKEPQPPVDIETSIVIDNGEVLETHKCVLDENFVFKNLLNQKTSSQKG